MTTPSSATPITAAAIHPARPPRSPATWAPGPGPCRRAAFAAKLRSCDKRLAALSAVAGRQRGPTGAAEPSRGARATRRTGLGRNGSHEGRYLVRKAIRLQRRIQGGATTRNGPRGVPDGQMIASYDLLIRYLYKKALARTTTEQYSGSGISRIRSLARPEKPHGQAPASALDAVESRPHRHLPSRRAPAPTRNTWRSSSRASTPPRTASQGSSACTTSPPTRRRVAIATSTTRLNGAVPGMPGRSPPWRTPPGRRPSCYGCHTVSQNGNVYAASGVPGGWNAVPDPVYHNVQCESCHGPGVVHVTNPNTTNIPFASALVTPAGETCVACHSGAHHPFAEQWSQSAHANLRNEPGGPAETPTSCGVSCHSGPRRWPS